MKISFTLLFSRGSRLLTLFACLPLAMSVLLSATARAMNPDTVFVLRQTTEEQKKLKAEPTINLEALDRPINPETYLVGPGDGLSINIWGAVHRDFAVTISPEATAIVPTVGEIPLARMTLAQAKEVILDEITRVYPRVSASVTLVKVRTLKVAVTGAVKNPGMYQVTANMHAGEAIEAAGWLPNSSRRLSCLLRGNDTLLIDYQRFANGGDDRFNPYLSDGDRVFVPPARTGHGVIDIRGEVNQPGTFEFVRGDRLAEALGLALGVKPEADTTTIELVRFIDSDTSVFKQIVNLLDHAPGAGRDLALRPDDRIFVRRKLDYRPIATVTILGEVIRPGSYPIQNGQTLLSELFSLCGGVTPRADLAGATLIRSWSYLLDTETDERMRSIPVELQTAAEREWILAHSLAPAGQVSMDLVRLLETGDAAYDLPLWNDDYVYVPRFLPQIKVMGRVANPGLIPFEPDRDPDYYLERAGGYSWRADRRGTFIIKANTSSPLNKKKVKKIDAGDIIVVPTVQEKKFWPILRDAMVVLGNVATLYLVIDQAAK